MSDKIVIYKEIIPLGKIKIHNAIIIGTIFLLTVSTIIFITTKISVGALSTGLTLIFIVVMALTLRNLKLFVTNEEFIVKYWFLTFRLKLSDIESVEIKDVDLLPEPWRGHLKVYWGIDCSKGLGVVKFRKGDAVHIRTKNGQTTIVTAENNQRLADALKKKPVEK